MRDTVTLPLLTKMEPKLVLLMRRTNTRRTKRKKSLETVPLST
jgi:hypothetical protein